MRSESKEMREALGQALGRGCGSRPGGDAAEALVLTLVNGGVEDARVRITDAACGGAAREVVVGAGAAVRESWPVAESGGWYDLLVTGPEGATTRLAGHVETGRASITDPAAQAPVLARLPVP